ncbi:MAG TPA: hypothetical protein VK081_09245 [Planctomycetota bacterium]|nr:hypothetical protein [Planctomycetota bacterium]
MTSFPRRAGFAASCILLSSVCGVLTAQETYFVAARTARTISEVSSCGTVINTIPMTTDLRSCHVAPDGKIWVVRFIQSQFDILNPDGSVFATVTFSLGSPYDIAFDAAGHAWVSGGSGVEEFDANGNSLGAIPLATASPLGITVDSDGNKWIAHRISPPGAVTKIDALTRQPTTFPLTNSQVQPTRIVADFRGTGVPSHVWVVGDGTSGELIEVDSTGTQVASHVVAAGGQFGSVIADIDRTLGTVRNIWVGDFRSGRVHQVDAASGTTVNTYIVSTDVLGLAIDGFGNLWATTRTTPQVVRIDPVNGTLEVAADVGAGVQAALSTRYHHATVVDPHGDLDGDGVSNLLEVVSGVSPFDSCSQLHASLSIDGPTSLGSTPVLNVTGASSNVTAVAFSLGRGPAVSVPGIGCAFRMDMNTLVPSSVIVPGAATVPFPIPNNPRLVGLGLHMQGLAGPASFTFTNVVCVKIY